MNVNVSIFLNVFVSESVKIVRLRQNRHKAIHLHPLVWDRQTDSCTALFEKTTETNMKSTHIISYFYTAAKAKRTLAMNFWLNNRFGIATTTTAQKAKWGVFKLSKHHQISTFSKKKIDTQIPIYIP